MAKKKTPVVTKKLRVQKETLRKLLGVDADQLGAVHGGACWPSGGNTYTGKRNTAYC